MKTKYTNPKTKESIIVDFTNCEQGGCSTLAGAAQILGADTGDGSFTEEDKEDSTYIWWEDINSTQHV